MPRSLTVMQVVPSLEAGGAERATVDVAAALANAGHRPLVVSKGGYMLAELQKKRGVHLMRNVDSKNPITIIGNALWLAGVLLREKVDVVHARSRAPAWSVYLATRMTGTPFVTTFHAAYKGDFFLKKFYNSIMAKSDCIIAISGFIAAHVKKHYGVADSHIAVIPRGIDMQVYNPAAVSQERKQKLLDAWEVSAGTPILVMPGRLSPIKGHELVLEALARLKQRDFVCIFIGPDQGRTKYREKLLEMVRDYGLGTKIKWMEGSDVPAAYALAHLVLSPSQVAEGFGRVPVEAEAFGAPIIATALGATSETVLDGETGWLVPKGDVDALSNAIEAALNLAPEARETMSQKAKDYVRGKFDMNQMCAATLAVYQKLAKDNN